MRKDKKIEFLAIIYDLAMVHSYHVCGDDSYQADDLWKESNAKFRGAKLMIDRSGIGPAAIRSACNDGRTLGEELRFWEIENGIEYCESTNIDRFRDRISDMVADKRAGGDKDYAIPCNLCTDI